MSEDAVEKCYPLTKKLFHFFMFNKMKFMLRNQAKKKDLVSTNFLLIFQRKRVNNKKQWYKNDNK